MITKAAYHKKTERLAAALPSVGAGGLIGLKKNTSNLFRFRQQSKNTTRIDVRDFNNVITIDKNNLLAEVEGMVTYEKFVNETLKRGLLPAVVPELKGITVGGAISGTGLESSSFRYGFVHESVLEI